MFQNEVDVVQHNVVQHNQITASIDTVILQIPKNMGQVSKNRLRILLTINGVHIEVQ